jgi:hypothetical protein
VQRRCAAAAQAQLHAIQYYRREQFATLRWRASVCTITADELLALLLILLSSSAVLDDVARCLSLFPWAAFLLRFVERSRVRDATVLQLRIDTSLQRRAAVERLLWQAAAPAQPAFAPSRSADAPPSPSRSAEELTDQLAATLRAHKGLMSLDAAFVACVARQYDLVRWLALPDVLQRSVKYTSEHASFALCDAWQPSALKALVLLCAPHVAEQGGR